MEIEILSAGPLTTVQDLGRFGYLESGIGSAGVMDRAAYAAANELVGNKNNEAVLELTLYGAQIRFSDEAVIAVTGADMNPVINGEAVEMYRALKVRTDDVLALGMAAAGCRAYIAVRGGIDVEPVMNSRSTDLKAKIGGFMGRKLSQGDILKIGESRALSHREEEKLFHKCLERPDYSGDVTVRVIEGPQEEYFTEKGIESFYGEAYKVLPESDRMGIRLSGDRVESKEATDIISDGIVFGSVQIPASGQPIILMADHQTTGGYAKIATVVSEDLSLLAQLKPGNTVSFVKADISEVQPGISWIGRIFG